MFGSHSDHKCLFALIDIRILLYPVVMSRLRKSRIKHCGGFPVLVFRS